MARFLEREVEPHAAAWEATGMVPRDVLRRMGQAGLLGLMYEGEFGGGDGDALTNLVFAEALSQSTFAGFIITVLVHTDMAGPHLHHAGNAAQKAKYLKRVTAGELIDRHWLDTCPQCGQRMLRRSFSASSSMERCQKRAL